MAAESVGRKLGIGLRLAAKAVQHQASQASAAPGPSNATTSARPAIRPSAYAAPAAAKAKGVARGARRFGEAIWGPMAHTGGVLWLEITGLFFALFAAFFGQNVYKMRHDYAGGPEHTHLLVYAVFTVLFTWFTFTSFYKARQKERKIGPAAPPSRRQPEPPP